MTKKLIETVPIISEQLGTRVIRPNLNKLVDSPGVARYFRAAYNRDNDISIGRQLDNASSVFYNCLRIKRRYP